jgi:hypothetical protein|tara:strand:- start:14 stop:196 length:183 start_codon:yes stop_codon:yes gene_type:complete
MKCYVCKEKLVWGGDHVFDEEESKNEEYDIVTNLSCNNCNAFVLVYQKAKEFKGEYDEKK